MKKILTLLLLLSALPTALTAREKPQRGPFAAEHELRLTAGAYPLLPYFGEWGCDADYPPVLRNTHRGPLYTSGAWSLSYGYRFRRWFDLGLTCSYYGEYSRSYSNRDLSPVHRNLSHAVTLMPLARFTWVNTPWVRMYSTLGLGATISSGDCGRETLVSFQLTPVGIAVGRSFFGFAEAGFGAQGALMMGIGYRFNSKNSHKR